MEVNRIGYGGMQLTGSGVWGDAPQRDTAKQVLQNAYEAGVNFFDTADAYGPHTNEVLIEEVLHPYYDNIVIATKGGLTRPGPGQWIPNGHPDYIRKAIDGSLLRLKTGTGSISGSCTASIRKCPWKKPSARWQMP